MGRRNRAGRQRKAKHVQTGSAKKAAYQKLKAKRAKKPNNLSAVKAAWNTQQTVKENMDDMGLVYNMNDLNKMDVDKIRSKRTKQSKTRDVEMTDCEPEKQTSTAIIAELETEAAKQRAPAYHVSEPHMQFVVHMMEKYGEDYEAMARDSKNHYQETASQIKRRVGVFKKTTQYRGYLKAKEMVS